jgi:hypothetical protein
MAYRTGVALHHAVRDGAVACDEAVRNAGPTMIAVARIATSGDAGGMGLEAASAVTASPARRGVEGMKAAATKTASGMKATATVETTTTATVETTTSATVETTPAATVETTAPATVEASATAAVETTAPATVEAAATAAMKTAATAMARLGYVCEREPRHCARQNPSER